MLGHAIADRGSGSFGQEARADPERRRRRSGAGSGRRPEVERPLVGLVRLREAQRHVERERELEQHERDRVPLAAALQERQQLPVVADRLVERVLLPRPITGAREVRDRLVLVVGAEPVVGEQSRDLVLAAGVPLLEPLRGLAMQPRRARSTTSVR